MKVKQDNLGGWLGWGDSSISLVLHNSGGLVVGVHIVGREAMA